jgi:hypothetical protein
LNIFKVVDIKGGKKSFKTFGEQVRLTIYSDFINCLLPKYFLLDSRE